MSAMNEEITFRYAKRSDTSLILQFIKELADYEKMSDEVTADEKTLEEWIFDKQKAEVIFAVMDGREAGSRARVRKGNSQKAGLYCG